MIRKVEIERFTLISSKQFDEVVAALDAGIGHPDMADFGRSTREARSFVELKNAVEKGLSKAGLMLFMQLDHGAILRKETGHDTPKMIRWIVAKPEVIQTGSGRLVPGSQLVERDLRIAPGHGQSGSNLVG